MNETEHFIFKEIDRHEKYVKKLRLNNTKFYDQIKNMVDNFIDDYIIEGKLVENKITNSSEMMNETLLEYNINEYINENIYKIFNSYDLFKNKDNRCLFQYCVKEYIDFMEEHNSVSFGIVFKFSKDNCKILVIL